MSDSSPNSYRELRVWQLAVDLSVEVFRLTALFPRSELYGLTGQMRSAAVSIASNIAEGNARWSAKEYLHFVAIAAGSLRELETQIVIAGRLGFIEDTADLLGKTDRIARHLTGLRQSLLGQRKRLEDGCRTADSQSESVHSQQPMAHSPQPATEIPR